ncbi:MAG: 3-hydroxyacyl-CoA dehydrogenase family protein [Chitinophagaceae bacterium]
MQKNITIAVCGAGTMGTGIAQTLICNGFKTIVYELNPNVLSKSKTSLFAAIENLFLKGKISQQQLNFAKDHIVYTSDLKHVIADIIVEAIVENIDAKTNLFSNLMDINSNETVYATNTSSISINAIAKALNNNKNIVGLHFFNPAPLMKLVEVIKSDYTSTTVVNTMLQLCAQLQKTAVICNDAPGFIVNRVARHYYLQAMSLVEEGKANIKDIDELMEASGFKMGPFKLMDLIGLDINYGVSQIVFNDLGKPERLKPSPLQAQKVTDGKLGKKTGEGFYIY